MRSEEAANLVGMSKKSLDDYFGQLRLGELYGFNFAKNLDKMFGLLRTFVRKHKRSAKKPPKHRHMKYPKKLSIMDNLLEKPEKPNKENVADGETRLPAPLVTVL